MTRTLVPTRMSDAAKQRLTILFIAKHALGDGSLHAEDGNHAVYHHEVRTILEEIGVGLEVANSYTALFDKPEGVDFVFPLLNRGGFMNSEMLLPLLCTRLGIPFLGASPILRGLSDDKHLTKLEAVARGVETIPWKIFRNGAPVTEDGLPKADRYVIKPNASSASWGVGDASDWAGIVEAVARIHAENHDAIVEPFMDGSDIEVPVITIGGAPTILPPMLFRQADPTHLRTYWEKRDLVDRSQKYSLEAFEGAALWPQIAAMTLQMAEIFRPFDYGRYEFRFNEATGEVKLLEVNLNCNLWSQKVYGRSAVLAGWNQRELIETILAESLLRARLIGAEDVA